MGLEIKVTEKDTVKDTEKDTVKLNKSQLRILEIISRDPNITIEGLSAKIHINIRNTKKNISKLKELGNLKRIGSDKTGHWEIVKK